DPDTAILPAQPSDAPTRSIRGSTIGQRDAETAKRSSAREDVPLFDRRFWLVGIFALVILALGFAGYRYLTNAGGKHIQSIAVLPFENNSGDPNTDYLSDGLSESLIYRLSQISNLKVSTRSSVFRYKGNVSDPINVGSQLGVDGIVTGRIVQRGDNLTISVELNDVRSNK